MKISTLIIFLLLAFDCQQTTVNGQQTLSKASIAVRNFPLSAEELRKHLGFKDGDDFYIFGTTMRGEKKILVLGKRVEN